MDTTTLKDLPPVVWYPFSLENSAEIRKIAPHQPGIYIIRFQKQFRRFFGKTDIAYIGRAKLGKSRRKGLNRRMCEYFDLTPHRSTCYRVMTWIEKIGHFEIAFFPFSTDTEAINKETLFLQQFEKEHAELPPFNRQG